MSLLAPISPMLGKLLPRLGSNHDGEVVATARAIERVLRGAGRDWHDLATAVTPIAPPSDWRSLARFCADHAKLLSERELDFLSTLARYREAPSPKQLKWLCDIAARLQGRSR